MQIQNKMWNLIFMLLLAFTQLIYTQKYEFDVCDKSAAGTHYCRKEQDCKSSQGLVNGGKPMKVCSRRGRVSIVCCPPNAAKTSTTSKNGALPRNVTSNAAQVFNPNSILIVEQMCRKYGKEQYDTIIQPGALIGDPDTILKEPRCSGVQTLVVGGVQADPMEFPHMALIGYGKDLEHVEWHCGGSLISDRYVLSAAHCSNGGKIIGDAKWVRLGELDYSTKSDIAQDVDYEIIERINYPQYKHPSKYHDIALFKLNKAVAFSAFVRPICLNTAKSITYREATAAGWGVIGTGYAESEILMKVNVSLVTTKNCRQTYGIDKSKFSRGIEMDKMLCAGEVAGGKDTCSGDSGGPLMVKITGEPCLYSQIGVVSFGDGFCGKPGQPGVYTRVSNYISWIQQIVWP